MIEYDGTSYELAYGRKRIEVAEASLGKSILAVFSDRPTIKDLVIAMACGMRREGESAWMNPKQASKVAEECVEELGYATCYQQTIEAIDRDCGFLFR